jgi:hypothetical protein
MDHTANSYLIEKDQCAKYVLQDLVTKIRTIMRNALIQKYMIL